MSAAANRGKYSEGKVKDHLKAIEASHMAFTYNRVQDAHAAGGRFVPQAGDFQAFADLGLIDPDIFLSLTGFVPLHAMRLSRNFLIEVKELKHDFRLPHASYSADKVARVQKRVLAGSEAIVILYHSTTKLWRAVPFHVFTDRSVGGSWDLRDYPTCDYRTALNEFLGFAP